MITDCPDIACLRDYLAAALPASRDEALADHVEICPACQAQLEILVASGPSPHVAEPTPPGVPDAPFLRLLQAFGPEDGDRWRANPPPTDPSHRHRPLPNVPGYTVLSELGRGGMGVVYQARHQVLGRLVAVKVLPTDLYPTDEDRQRLRGEAEAIARLRHPNIIQLYEFGEADGRPYLVLEYADGGTLRDWADGRPRPPREAAQVVETIARAIQHAHSRDTLHGDLKPGNILLTTAEISPTAGPRVEHLKVSDFGLARRLDFADSHTCDLVGSPAYMAPEQVPDNAAGPRSTTGPATDVYALGVILYELLAGRPPFAGADGMTVLWQVRIREPLPPRQIVPGVPRDLETVCLKCLEKAPLKRYPSAAALADDLRSFLDDRPIQARPVGPVGRLMKWTRRKPLPAGALATAGLALALTVITLAAFLVSVRQQQSMEHQLLDQTEAGLYASRIAQADLLWRDCDLKQAAAVLDSCSVERRQWEWYYLRALCDDGFLALSAPEGHAVHAVATDGRRIAAVSGAGGAPSCLLIWDVETGRELARQAASHAAPDSRIIFLPDQRSLVTAGPSPSDTVRGASTVQVWSLDPASADSLAIRPVRSVAVGPIYDLSVNGRWLVAADEGGQRLWDLTTDSPPVVLTGETAPLEAIAIYSRGSVVVGAAGKEDVFVWHPPAPAARFRWKADRVRSLAVSHNGQEVAGRETGGVFRRRNSTTGKPLHDEALFTRLPGPTDYSPNGRFILVRRGDGVRVFDTVINQRSVLSGPRGEASGNVTALGIKTLENAAATGESNGSVRLWELALGQPLGQDACIYRGHTGAVLGVTFDPTDSWLVSGGADGRVRAWDLTRSQRFLSIPAGPATVASGWSASGRHVLSLAGNHLMWHAATGRTHGERTLATGPPKLAAFAANGHRLVTAAHSGEDGWVWDLPESLPLDPKAGLPPGRPLAGCKGPLANLAASSDGRLAVASGRIGPGATDALYAWNLDDGRLLWRVDAAAETRAIAVCSGAEYVAVAPAAGSPRLLRAADGQEVAILSGAEDEAIRWMAFGPDGRTVAAAGRSVRVWSLPAGQLLWSESLAEPAHGLAFSPDGARLVAVLARGDLLLLDAFRGQPLLRLAGAPAATETGVTCPRFSPDGRRLLTASAGELLVWDAPLDLNESRVERRRAFHVARTAPSNTGK